MLTGNSSILAQESLGNTSSTTATVNRASRGIRVALVSVMFILGVATTFLLYGFIRMQKRKNTSTYQKLVKYLMVTDWFGVVGCLVALSIGIPNPERTFASCTVQILSTGIPITASMGHIIMISVYRLSMIRNLKKPRSKVTIQSRKHCICSVSIWVLTTLIWVMPFIAWGQPGTTLRTCNPTDQWPNSSPARYYFPVMFDTLWISTNVVYVWLYLTLKRQLSSVRPPEPNVLNGRHAGAYYLPHSTSKTIPNSGLPPVETNHGDSEAQSAPVVLLKVTPLLTLTPPSPAITSLVSNTTQTKLTSVRTQLSTPGNAGRKSAANIDAMFPVIVALFNISCTPTFLVNNTTLFNVAFDVPTLLPLFLLFNNVCNPIVYTWYMRDLQAELRDILKRIKQGINIL